MGKPTAEKKSIIVLDLGNLMEGKKFSSFNELRKEAYVFIKDYREHFVKIVLNNCKIEYDLNMTKREKDNLFTTHKIDIIKDEDKNRDEVHKDGKLIAFWNKEINLSFNNGRLLCTIEFEML